eukprot:ctg_83.g28
MAREHGQAGNIIRKGSSGERRRTVAQGKRSELAAEAAGTTAADGDGKSGASDAGTPSRAAAHRSWLQFHQLPNWMRDNYRDRIRSAAQRDDQHLLPFCGILAVRVGNLVHVGASGAALGERRAPRDALG